MIRRRVASAGALVLSACYSVTDIGVPRYVVSDEAAEARGHVTLLLVPSPVLVSTVGTSSTVRPPCGGGEESPRWLPGSTAVHAMQFPVASISDEFGRAHDASGVCVRAISSCDETKPCGSTRDLFTVSTTRACSKSPRPFKTFQYSEWSPDEGWVTVTGEAADRIRCSVALEILPTAAN